MIVVCGEALMDVFAHGETPTGMELDARVGGSPFNVAVGLARMQQRVGFFGSVSLDFLGERLLRALNDEGVDTRCVARTSAATTLSLVGTDADGVPSYAFYGHGGADRQLVPEQISTLPATLAALHLGSYSTVVEPIGSTLRALVEREHSRTLISLDPNIRLNVEPDIGCWRELLDWMLPRTHLLKISEEDLGLLMPGATPEDFCRDALARGVRLTVVTRGSAGVLACTAAASVNVPAVAVPVVDTVGAGDSFQAALLAWLQENGRLSAAALGALHADALKEGLAFASRAAAVTCSRRGADLPHRNEIF